jgi:hypothetical protein
LEAGARQRKCRAALTRGPGKKVLSMQNIQRGRLGRNSEAIERKFSLPFGYHATFRWHPGELLEVQWAPNPPRIREGRARRKFFAAYQAARHAFLEEVAAVVGGNVLVVDTNLREIVATEIIRKPTRH